MSASTIARPPCRAPHLVRLPLDRASAVLAIALLLGWAMPGVFAVGPDDAAAARTPSAPGAEAKPIAQAPEMLVGAYFGRNYTHPSDVHFRRTGGAIRDFTVDDVAWEGQPFKHPLYYGIRVARWAHGGEGAGRFGGMVDFVHAKAIADMAQDVRLDGRLDGEPLPARGRIGDLFAKLEFSHGHNMLFAAGMMRLQSLAPRVSPYVGVGVGISLPHTEIHIAKHDPKRTYEYQYTGPAAQLLGGLEFRLPRVSLFLEYKFTIAHYSAPLSGREGTWFPIDMWRQWRSWWNGELPPGGHADTLLASHQIVGGLAFRIAPPAAAR